jgi:hypothetical protein
MRPDGFSLHRNAIDPEIALVLVQRFGYAWEIEVQQDPLRDRCEVTVRALVQQRDLVRDSWMRNRIDTEYRPRRTSRLRTRATR